MIERKYLAHYIDSAFDTTCAAPSYVRLGKDLEEYALELNPDVKKVQNILGENSVRINGYEASSTVEPFYADYDDSMSERIMEIAMERLTGDECKTTVVDVLLQPSGNDSAPTAVWAYREDCVVVPESIGGDTSGVQVPFTIHRNGNRVRGSFDLTTKAFTAYEL